MSASVPTIRIYYLPLTFPCGPSSGCCGPIGQTEEEIQSYIAALRKELGQVEVETIEATFISRLDQERDGAVLRLLNTFGAMALPIFALNGEVVSMGGPPSVEEVVELFKGKLSATT